MSTNTNQQDWWDIFTHMSVEKLKKRHRSEIEMYPSSFSNQFYIQVKGTKFVHKLCTFDLNVKLVGKT